MLTHAQQAQAPSAGWSSLESTGLAFSDVRGLGGTQEQPSRICSHSGWGEISSALSFATEKENADYAEQEIYTLKLQSWVLKDILDFSFK